MQDVPDCRRYDVIFPFTDDQPCCSVEDCLKLTQMNVVGASQYTVVVVVVLVVVVVVVLVVVVVNL